MLVFYFENLGMVVGFVIFRVNGCYIVLFVVL